MCMRMRLLLILLLVSGLLLFFHWAGITYTLYWVFAWYDLLTHFLGGVVLALSLAVFGKYKGYEPPFSHLLIFAFGVGIIWELFELWAGIPREAGFLLDTTIDLGMDMLGAVFAYFLTRNIQKTS